MTEEETEMDFTFLKEEQIWGDDALGVMTHYGTEVYPTDLAVILGGFRRYDDRPRRNSLPPVNIAEDNYLSRSASCRSLLSSSTEDGEVCYVDFYGNKDHHFPLIREISARPALCPTEAAKITPTEEGTTANLVRYGEYPQMVADARTSEKLEKLFSKNFLPTTGKNYTFDSATLFSSEDFKPVTYPEYRMNGRMYIRVPGRPHNDECILSNGEYVQKGKPYWVEVQPIDWLLDKSGWMVARQCLFAGIQFDTKDSYDGNFSKTFMKHYMDTYFAKEMSPIDREMPRRKSYDIEIVDEQLPVKDQINFYIQNGMSFMLHGPSGVGKSARVKEIDPNLTSITLCNGILPEDVIGKTIYPNGVGVDGAIEGVWVPPKWYTDLCKKCESEPDKQHVLFIDEVTNARETTQSLIYHVALEKSIAQGVGKLPDNAVVVLAGNSKEESGAAYNMPAPLFRRLSHIYLKSDIPGWLEWGSEHCKSHPEVPDRLNIHPLVASFVATYGRKVFYSEYDEEDPAKFALDPRKWEKVSDKIYANKGVLRREILEADIGSDLAQTFLAYAKNPPLSLEDVIECNYEDKDIPKRQDARLAMALSLRHASPQQVGIVREFIKDNLGAENCAIFDSVWAGKDDTKALQIAKLRANGGR